MCGLLVPPPPPRSPIDDVSRMFPKFVLGSFVESFGVSLSGELLGLGEGGTRFSHQNRVGLYCGHKGT